MNKPRPSAVILATGLTVAFVGTLLSMLGGIWLWVGLAAGAVGAYQTITGVYRLAAAVDYIAARPVVRRTEPAPDHATQ